MNTGFENNYKNAVREIIRVGTSAGGARAKAVIAVNDKTKKVRSGQAEGLNSLIRTISNLFLSRLKLLEIIFDLEIHVIGIYIIITAQSSKVLATASTLGGSLSLLNSYIPK